MFDEAKFINFRLQQLQVAEEQNVLYRYVYVDSQNDIIDIHGKLWQIESISRTINDVIKISGEQTIDVYPNGRVIKLLQSVTKFKGIGTLDSDGWIKTYLGLYDLTLTPASNINQFNSLVPHVKAHEKLWISDLAMEGSPTYFSDLFDATLWFAFLIIFTLIGLASAVGIWFIKKFKAVEIDHLNWFAILVNQGANETLDFISRRLLLITLAIVTILFHGAFGAFMSSSLSIRHPDIPFSDITSLLSLPAYTICSFPMTISLKEITHEASKIAHAAKINGDDCPNVFRNFDGSVNSVKTSEMYCPRHKTVYFGLGMCLFPGLSENCAVSAIRGKYFDQYVSIVKYPGFKYQDFFNQGILLLKSSGHLDYLMRQNDLRQIHFTCARQFVPPDLDMQVSLYQISYLLLIMFLGFGCSITIIVFELIYKKWNR